MCRTRAMTEARYSETTEDPRPWEKYAATYHRMGTSVPADGSGPWDDEPDRIEWLDPTTGLPCLMKRGPMGQWNGYVGVFPKHPWHGRDYGDVEELVDVHGGLTYAGSWYEEGDWWFGFDCGHYMDLQPGFPTYGEPLFGETYKDVAYVKAEVTVLALQVAVISVNAS
jgi:hypothetical protein